MSKQAQTIHMLVRVSRLAAKRWQVQLSEAVTIPESSGALGYIAHNFGLFRIEGNDAVLGDVEKYLLGKGDLTCRSMRG